MSSRHPKTKQRREILTGIKYLATAFYYLVSLTVMLVTLWDRFVG